MPHLKSRRSGVATANSTGKMSVKCVGCKTTRSITLNQAAKGQPFCPKCGNMEIAIKVKT